MSHSVLIVGFGNSLMGDDGAGPAVVDRLRARGLPDEVRAEAGDTDSLRVPSLWQGESEIWLVDAVIHGDPPGTIHRLDHDEILAAPQRHATVHHLSLPESLRWITLAYPEMAHVRYRLWGIEPDRVALDDQLSAAVDTAASAVTAEIMNRLGGPRAGVVRE